MARHPARCAGFMSRRQVLPDFRCVGVADVARIDPEQRSAAQDEGGITVVFRLMLAARPMLAMVPPCFMVLAIQARTVAAEVVDRAGPGFLAQRLDLRQVERLAQHDLAGTQALQVIGFASLPVSATTW
jgi:hypothetical protein